MVTVLIRLKTSPTRRSLLVVLCSLRLVGSQTGRIILPGMTKLAHLAARQDQYLIVCVRGVLRCWTCLRSWLLVLLTLSGESERCLFVIASLMTI